HEYSDMAALVTDPWQSLVDEGWERAKRGTGYTEEAECATVVLARTFGGITAGEGFDRVTEEALTSIPMQGMLRWICVGMLDVIPTEKREKVLFQLGFIDPPSAAAVFFLHKERLSQKERKMLFDLFAPTMSVAAKKDRKSVV